MKFNKNIIISIITIIFLLSALVYNLLYINNKKNEIIEEIEEVNDIETELKIEEEPENIIYVHIAGAVAVPGVYGLKEGSRVNDLIILAGGLLDNADLTDVNLAYILTDAIKVTIPVKETKKQQVNIISKSMNSNVSNVSKNSSFGQININTATISELKTLSGIGDSTANKIIEYRNNNNGFKSIDELKNVSGIGTVKYEKIKDKITV